MLTYSRPDREQMTRVSHLGCSVPCFLGSLRFSPTAWAKLLSVRDLGTSEIGGFVMADWSIMFILARQGATYGRLQSRVGPWVTQRLSANVDYSLPFDASDHDAWTDEYEVNVEAVDPFASHRSGFLLDRYGFTDIEQCTASEWVAS